MPTKDEEKSPDCRVDSERFVVPCRALADEVELYGNAGRGKGIFKLAYTDMSTGEPSRTMFGIKTAKHPKGGLLFNFCPWCGADISVPFKEARNG